MTRFEQIGEMEAAVARSHGLWLSVNKAILEVLKSNRTAKQAARYLRSLAGKKRSAEPCSVENFRIAARQLERGQKIVVL